MNLIAGRVDLHKVMGHLAGVRPLFHSEADFQFAFAQAVRDLDPEVRVRLEVPQRTVDRRTYVDLLCEAEQRTLIEFKYVTRHWDGADPNTGEKFLLRSHSALDLARLYFIHDVTRLEGWVKAQDNTNGFAVLLTNDPGLWEPARRVDTRDHAFRLHQGRTLTGPLLWGTTAHPYPGNNRDLQGIYTADWHHYSQPDTGPGGTFQWLGWAVDR